MGPPRLPGKPPPACQARRGALTAGKAARTLSVSERLLAVCDDMFAIAPTSPARGGAIVAMAMLFAVDAAAQQTHVAVTAIVETASLDAVRSGLRDGLRDGGYTDGRNLLLTFESAGANLGSAARIANRMASAEPDVIVAISVPSSVAVLSVPAAAPIIFTAVGSRRNLPAEIRHGAETGRAAGLTTSAPIGEALALIREIGPDVLTVGLLFPAGTAELIARTRRVAHGHGLRIVAPPVAAAESTGLVASMAERIDALLLLPRTDVDFHAIVELAEASMLPIYAFDAEWVASGAVAAVGHDNYDLGRQTARLVLRVLNGEPAVGAIEDAVATRLVINPDAAERVGFRIPAAVVDRAQMIFD